MSDTTSVGDETTMTPEARVRTQVQDALELANFAVSTGFRSQDGQPLTFGDIATIQMAAAQIGLIGIPADRPGPITVAQWDQFEQAYYRLATTLSPVTAETLRDTRDTARPRGNYASFWFRLRDFVWGYSPAQRFTRELWFLAFFFAAAIIALESFNNILSLKKDAASVAAWRFLCQSLVPWAYGGLGACAFMLRSAHYFIYQRSFDCRRTPEYFNRILLGAISGGAIVLFTEYLVNPDDSTAGHLGAGALGFIAGYSGDLLFNTIERIVNAIFPKVSQTTGPTDDDKKKAAAANPPPKPSGGDAGADAGGDANPGDGASGQGGGAQAGGDAQAGAETNKT